MLPDLFGYWLTGALASEQTIASTSQLLDVRQRRWAIGVIEKLGLPRRLFDDEVVPAGTPVGLAAGPSTGRRVPLWTPSPGTTPRRPSPPCPAAAPVRLHLLRVPGRWSAWS